MSSDERRITPDELGELAEVRDITTLKMWAEDPYGAADVGAETVAQARLGQTEHVLVHGDLVLWGGVMVEAEHHQPLNGGTVSVIDVAGKGWSLTEAKAEVLRRFKRTADIMVDSDLLAELVTQLHAEDQLLLSQVGWDGDDIDALLEQIERDGAGGLGGDAEHQDDAPIPSVPTDPVTRPGDIWLLGPHHRIMCGDSRDPDHVAILLDGATINLAFTSPPYADRRKYDESSGFKPIPPDEYVAWFEPVQANVAKHIASDGSWFVNIKNGSRDSESAELYVFDLVLAHARQWGWNFGTEFCWERLGVPGLPERRFKNQFEPVYHFVLGRWKFNPANVQYPSNDVPVPGGPGSGQTSTSEAQGTGIAFFGKARVEGRPTSAIERAPGMAYPGNRLPPFTGSHEALGHGAAFPVGLPDFFVRAYTDEGDTVYDPFMGSGSTLLAAHQNGRVGYGMELSPAYVDVILTRFQRVTGIVPTRDGEPHDFGAG